MAARSWNLIIYVQILGWFHLNLSFDVSDRLGGESTFIIKARMDTDTHAEIISH